MRTRAQTNTAMPSRDELRCWEGQLKHGGCRMCYERRPRPYQTAQCTFRYKPVSKDSRIKVGFLCNRDHYSLGAMNSLFRQQDTHSHNRKSLSSHYLNSLFLQQITCPLLAVENTGYVEVLGPCRASTVFFS